MRIRALDCHDFVAAEARYHVTCHRDFTTGKRLSTATPGRPVVSESLNNFNRVCEWLELEAELHSVVEVHTKMTEIADGEDVYGTKWLKAKLRQKYGHSIYFSEIGGRSDVVCFKRIADYLINESWYANRKESSEDEAEIIIIMAAKLIFGGIRTATYNCDSYPCDADIKSAEQGLNWLPHYLRIFIESLIKKPLKEATILDKINGTPGNFSSLTPLPHNNVEKHNHNICLTSVPGKYTFCAL